MNRNEGFTLVELVMVIILLGILAVTAAPKFLDLSRDAKIATLHGVAGAMKSAAELTASTALIRGEDGERGKVSVDGNIVELKWGYPEAYGEEGSDDLNWGIVELLEIDGDLVICYDDGSCMPNPSGSPDSDWVLIGFEQVDLEEVIGISEGCFAYYQEADHGKNPDPKKYHVGVVDTDC